MPDYFVDTSVWIAGSFESHPYFPVANSFLAGPQRADTVWLARVVENSFLRLLTTAALCRGYDSPMISNPQAVEILGKWRSLPHIRCIDAEPEGTRELWLELAAIPSASPKLWMDAYLAAFAIRAGLPFATLDDDFRRFEAAGLQFLLLSA